MTFTRTTAMLGVAAAAAALLATPAAATTTADCGYFIRGIEAYYGHCTSDGSHIQIRMDLVGEPDRNRCVGPGETHLGPALIYRGAYYTGRLC